MREIKEKGITYAIVDTPQSIEQLDMGRALVGTQWYGDKQESLQGSRMLYHAGKEFRVHRHKLNQRRITHTQEAMVCFSGRAEVVIYNCYQEVIETVILKSGSIIFLYRGYHGLKIMEDNTILYELKCGSFTNVEEDKEFFNE